MSIFDQHIIYLEQLLKAGQPRVCFLSEMGLPTVHGLSSQDKRAVQEFRRRIIPASEFLAFKLHVVHELALNNNLVPVSIFRVCPHHRPYSMPSGLSKITKIRFAKRSGVKNEQFIRQWMDYTECVMNYVVGPRWA